MSSYCTPGDLAKLAMPTGGLAPFQTTEIVQLHLDTASDTVDSYLADQVTLPLVAPFPLSIKMRVCQIAAYTLLVQRGYNPDVGGDKDPLEKAYDAAMVWLESISEGKIKPPLVDSSPNAVAAAGGPDVLQVSVGHDQSQARVPGEDRFVHSGGGTVRVGTPRLRGF